jgi:hypothetical protein
MSEREWSHYVVNLAGYGNWIHYHTYDSRRSNPGFPDLVLVRPPELIVAELKAERGKLSDAQKYWLEALEQCGVEVYVWRPTDELEVRNRLRRKPHGGNAITP